MTDAEASPDAAPVRRATRRGRPVEVALVAGNLPFVVRTFAGLATLVVAANIVGALVVAGTTIATNANATHHQAVVLTVSGAVIVAVQAVVGITAGAIVQRRTMRWLLRGERPSVDDAHRALRMPLELSVIVIILWAVGDLAMGVVGVIIGQQTDTLLGVAAGILLAGLSAAGITYLVVGRVAAPVARLALASCPPESAPVFGVRWRLFTIWLLTSAAPLLGIVLILALPRQAQNVRAASVAVAIATLLLGAAATLLTARSIGKPLRGVVEVLHQVGEGDLNVVVQVEDAGEIGLVQSGFNEMMAGLRERDRVTDLFGRHVGPAVASEALRSGVTLGGEARDVVALFVDITGSTPLTRRTEPGELVAILNRFFAIVVEAVEAVGGLVNKFEGDAALCVFGAPAQLPDPATAALVTARRIRDEVAAAGEVEVGVGVASGPVIAGQIGAASRLEYTVIGDAVNEAARLTDLAKRVAGHALASEDVVEAATPLEQTHWVRGRTFRLRGRDAPTHTYRAPTP